MPPKILKTMTAPILAASIVAVSGAADARAASDCETQLADIDERLAALDGSVTPRKQAIAGLRELATQYCRQGRGELAQKTIEGIQRQLDSLEDGPAGASRTASDSQGSLPKRELTAEYLAGMWCMSSDRHDRIYPVEFKPDGSSFVGQPAGDRYGMFPNGDELEDFHRRFDRLVSVEREEFVVADRHGGERTYVRGACPGIEIGR